jgi:O-antigen/teichoic acid export membrane protein
MNRPRAADWRAALPDFRRELREFGRQVYAGRMVDGLTTGADRLLIGWFAGMAPLAMYSVAVTMTMPIGMLSRAMSGSAYRSFASSERIPRALLAANALWCIGGSALLLLACAVLVPLIFTRSYAGALALLPYLAAGVALAGLNMPFHAFLAARRQGRAIRVMSVTTSSVNVAANIALVPLLGAAGAGIAMICSYGLNIVMNLHYYRAVVRAVAAGDTPSLAAPERNGLEDHA